MPSVLPPGEPAPSDGTLPDSVVDGADTRAFGLYVHVPFCTVRCGYCDFNTYTADELRGHSRDSYPAQAMAEMDLAVGVMQRAGLPARPLSTVFFGGGTPTLLGPGPLRDMLQRARDLWGFSDTIEVTVEANPDTVTEADLEALRGAGVTRMSFGVQSTNRAVLATLDRTHTPESVPVVLEAAKRLGLEVSVDLIYGTPGELLADWEATLQDALHWDIDHLSAYALIVEEGTQLARKIKRGDIEPPDDDLHADMYQVADHILAEAGFEWYEISNWSKGPHFRSRHNRNYWLAEDWWGIGPGAHSHIGGTRWWNVKHPAAYADRLAASLSPAHAREVLSPDQRLVEHILLGIRTREGISSSAIDKEKAPQIAQLVARGLLDGVAAVRGQLQLTLQGRLLADHVVRELT